MAVIFSENLIPSSLRTKKRLAIEIGDSPLKNGDVFFSFLYMFTRGNQKYPC